MEFDVDDRVEIDRTGYGVAKGSSGFVQHVYKNGNLRVRVTHGPGCKKRPDGGKTILTVDPADLSRTQCGT